MIIRLIGIFSAGKDAARAFGTGCFQEHRTHDLRGLSDKQLAVRIPWSRLILVLVTNITSISHQGVEHWKKFFSNHKDYKRVGRVYHPPINPESPIPTMCDLNSPKKPEKAQVAPQPKPEAIPKHEEL